MSKKNILVVIILIVIIIGTIFLITNNSDKNSIDFSEYLSVSISGYDGYTETPTYVGYYLDLDKIETDINKKGGKIESMQFTDNGFLFDDEVINVEVNSGSDKMLQNGDVIKFTITFDKERIEAISGLKFKGKDIIKSTCCIEGLKAVTEINLFDYVYVQTHWGPESDYSTVDIIKDNLPDKIGDIEIITDVWNDSIKFVNTEYNRMDYTIYLNEKNYKVETRDEKVTLYVENYSDNMVKYLGEIGVSLSEVERTYTQTIIEE